MDILHEYRTPDFFVYQDSQTGAVEIWLDWEPHIDGDPKNEVNAWRDGKDLILQVKEGGQARRRRIPGIKELAWAGLDHKDGEIVICGASGILARKPLRITAERGTGS